MRAIWSGAVSFGLVSVPIKVYSATSNHDVRFHQVHGEDGGRIRYKRTCEVCGEEVTYADIVKGFETPEGELITLDENDLASLPVSTGHEIDVVEFVPNDQIDPMLFDKSYYLEPETKAAKPYALLREALNETDRTAVVKVALRQRETMALLRIRGKAIVLQTLIWPDEVREPEFDILDTDVELRPQELQMASSLVESMGADFDPAEFHDEYRDAMVDLIEAKKTHGDARPAPAAEKADDGADSMSDLLSALQASVDAARSSGGSGGSGGKAEADSGSGSSRSSGSKAGSKAGSQTGSQAEPKAGSSRSSSSSGSSGTTRKTASSRSRSTKATEEKETAATGTEGGGTKSATGTRRRSSKKTA
ncbi:non-homologous end joining protein Ku [Pseudonocardia parietis]|uniref:Non-homologous end joining protein Ku n=1 Tax=Pseudonocardia parietis TaxID=570936 RepID=A0ABS4VKP1_9PSEU|nr:Ku protein [Pseudonocardia parietis]MBP2364490.1 DNA end-binding protein Ku [Pseudonocardia parietis]